MMSEWDKIKEVNFHDIKWEEKCYFEWYKLLLLIREYKTGWENYDYYFANNLWKFSETEKDNSDYFNFKI